MTDRAPVSIRRGALGRVGERWDPDRIERLWIATQQGIRRARRRRGATLGGAILLLAMVLVGVRFRPAPSPMLAVKSPLHPVASASSCKTGETGRRGPHPIQLADGSRVEPLNEQAEVRVGEVTETTLTVDLRRGASRFQVKPDPRRQFVVRAGAVAVVVVGTEFLVELRHERTWVEVVQGVVSVRWDSGEKRLAAGERGVFPPEPSAAASAPAVRERRTGTEALRARVERHEYAEAYALLKASPSSVTSTVDDLLLAADVARLSGHPAEAVPFLERVVREHPENGKAALAAFTLGRTLLGLGHAREASLAFARVSVLAPGSALAEDALARRVEAASRAGDRAGAQQLAEEYLRTYPEGRRKAAVRQAARLE